MKSVIIAVGSNIGKRQEHLKSAGQFLTNLSEEPIRTSSIYLTEPVGPASRYFLNGVVEVYTRLSPQKLLAALKNYENEHGRTADHPRWSARTIDLDIIAYNQLLMHKDSLIIPHPEYSERLFVLRPLHDIHVNWRDPKTDVDISTMLDRAPNIQIKKTELTWYNE